jgi:hypothetical protein
VGGVKGIRRWLENLTYKENIGYIKVCTDFKILEVKVPIVFFGTQGFSARRDGRYLGR